MRINCNNIGTMKGWKNMCVCVCMRVGTYTPCTGTGREWGQGDKGMPNPHLPWCEMTDLVSKWKNADLSHKPFRDVQVKSKRFKGEVRITPGREGKMWVEGGAGSCHLKARVFHLEACMTLIKAKISSESGEKKESWRWRIWWRMCGHLWATRTRRGPHVFLGKETQDASEEGNCRAGGSGERAAFTANLSLTCKFCTCVMY